MARDHSCTFTVPGLRVRLSNVCCRPTVCGSNLLTSFRSASKPAPRVVLCTMSNTSPSRSSAEATSTIEPSTSSTVFMGVTVALRGHLLEKRPVLPRCCFGDKNSPTLEMLETRWTICCILVPWAQDPPLPPLLRSDPRSLTSPPLELATHFLSELRLLPVLQRSTAVAVAVPSLEMEKCFLALKLCR